MSKDNVFVKREFNEFIEDEQDATTQEQDQLEIHRENQNEVHILKQTNQTLRIRIDDLELQIRQNDQAAQKLCATAQATVLERDKLRIDLANGQNEIRQLKESNQVLTARIDDLELQLRQNGQNGQKLLAIAIERDKLKIDVANAQNEIRQLKETNQTLSARNEDLELQLRENGVYEVESIISHKRVRGGNFMFKIHWKGYSSSEDTWQKREDLNCENILNQYIKKNNLV